MPLSSLVAAAPRALAFRAAHSSSCSTSGKQQRQAAAAAAAAGKGEPATAEAAAAGMSLSHADEAAWYKHGLTSLRCALPVWHAVQQKLLKM